MRIKLLNVNFPQTVDGRVYHVGVKPGEVANRIITVGDPARAKLLAKSLDNDTPLFTYESQRGFLTITGRYRGTPISIIAIGMGLGMMDFFVREVRAVVDGPLAIIRYGSCGSFGSSAGNIVIPHGNFAITRNYDYFADDNEDTNSKPYNISKVFNGDPEIYALLKDEFSNFLDSKTEILTGLNSTSDSFYSSQGRQDINFRDDNQNLIEYISSVYPETQSLEMETFALYHLAKTSTSSPIKDSTISQSKLSPVSTSIKAGAALMIFIDRKNEKFISPERINFLENVAGKAILNALVRVKLDQVHDAVGSVWEQKVTEIDSGISDEGENSSFI
ncbi:hypothetical protein G9A89_020076 [Geosiphon pyriformis]|nr:hypothetical protein G9A89_020076 [Geosiphon pyriformis]